MTTIVVDLRNMEIAADTQNTDSSGTAYRCHKIERLSDGRYFLGSGHLLSIGKARRWAEKGFAEKHRPDLAEHFGKRADEYRFSVAVVNLDGTVTLVDDELEPLPMADEYFAIGSGGSFALGAMDAGASAEEAVKIACKRDLYTSEPVEVEKIVLPARRRR